MNDISKVHNSILHKQLELENTLALIANLILQNKNEPTSSHKLTTHERKILNQVANKLQPKTFSVPSTSPKSRRQLFSDKSSIPVSVIASTGLSPLKPVARRPIDKTTKQYNLLFWEEVLIILARCLMFSFVFNSLIPPEPSWDHRTPKMFEA